ncbi:MAG: glycoside hydrolase family 9 protein, partial [Opitutaceae bacterium]
MNGAMHVAATLRSGLFRIGLTFALLGAPVGASAAVGPVDGRVRLNSIGFTPDAPKQATVAASAATFRVLRVTDDAVALEGNLGSDIVTAANDTNETVRLADFTALRTAGEYQLDVPNVGRSAPFTIGTDVWREPLRLATRAFYLWRCGTAVTGTWNGRTYQHAACHLLDGWLDYVGGGQVRRDGSGGWHDAGDYNKYVVNAGVSAGLLFKAWEHHRARIGTLALALPESGNNIPDLLNELRWELDWLLKMQATDGRVYHKLSELNFTYWGAPQLDPNPRYFVPWSTTATADFVALLALGARHFAEFDPVYAARCLGAARTSWAALVANPTNVSANQTGFGTGGYTANDGVHRLWAAAEMWAATGEAEFLQAFEQRAATMNFTDI